jgi:hypothetical protein
MTKALIFQRFAINHERSGLYELHFSQKTVDFEYKNTIEKLYYESIGKHLKPYFITQPNEYDTTLLNSILEIPKLDNEAFTNMIRYAKLNNFKDINV